MKKLSSYAAPLAGTCTILLADFAIIEIQYPNFKAGSIVFLILYNLLVLLALWSLLSALINDPGYIPIHYQYDLSNMSRLVRALYQQVFNLKNENLDFPKDGDLRKFQEMKRIPQYTLTLPLLRGD